MYTNTLISACVDKTFPDDPFFWTDELTILPPPLTWLWLHHALWLCMIKSTPIWLESHTTDC